DNDAAVDMGKVSSVPIVGRVAAGQPILAAENIEETLPLPTEFSGEGTFILRVRGESMIDAGILDDDFVVVRQQNHASNGDVVVAMIEDEATVKTFYRESDRIRLQPENSTMDPIYSRDAEVIGKVVALFRRI
ncbi:MAG TPA: transcriptional repressor LexA, partial [Coriobacteriia bacterium]|nr:transcriptional repressor LexA [Coriobacteriia bacterium]